jgi:hypothetical protein
MGALSALELPRPFLAAHAGMEVFRLGGRRLTTRPLQAIPPPPATTVQLRLADDVICAPAITELTRTTENIRSIFFSRMNGTFLEKDTIPLRIVAI